MKIYLNQNGTINKVEDNAFVANAAGDMANGNLIDFFFVDNRGNNLNPSIMNISYCSLSVTRSDGFSITHINAPLTNKSNDQQNGIWCYEYIIRENDGVLYIKGELQISAQFVKATYDNLHNITHRDIIASVVVSGHVMNNIGLSQEDTFNETLVQAQLDRDTLQGEITQNTEDIAVLDTSKVDKSTSSFTSERAKGVYGVGYSDEQLMVGFDDTPTLNSYNLMASSDIKRALSQVTVDVDNKVDIDTYNEDMNLKADKSDLNAHIANISNPHSVTKSQVGLGNLSNDAQVKRDEMGVANGVATLDLNGKLPLAQLSDTILGQMANGGTFKPSTGIANLTTAAQAKLGTDLSTITLTNDTTDITGYLSNQGLYYYATAVGSFADIVFAVGDWLVSNASGWAKVDNTDAVVSVNGKSGVVVLSKNDIGLENVDNTKDINKPISSPQQTALNKKLQRATSAEIKAAVDNATWTGDTFVYCTDSNATSGYYVSDLYRWTGTTFVLQNPKTDDYNDLVNKPIINAELGSLDATMVAENQVYRNTYGSGGYTLYGLYYSDGTMWKSLGSDSDGYSYINVNQSGTIVDLNDYIVPGTYTFTRLSSGSNLPTTMNGNATLILTVYRAGTSVFSRVQEARVQKNGTPSTLQVFRRSAIESSWTEWSEVTASPIGYNEIDLSSYTSANPFDWHEFAYIAEGVNEIKSAGYYYVKGLTNNNTLNAPADLASYVVAGVSTQIEAWFDVPLDEAGDIAHLHLYFNNKHYQSTYEVVSLPTCQWTAWEDVPFVPVVQVPGQSTTDVMSQNATTAALEAKQDKLNGTRTAYSDSFISRVTAGYNNEVLDDSTASVKSLQGMTIKQLLNKANYPATTTTNGITFTNNGDGSIKANGTATALIVKTCETLAIVGGHKFYIAGCPTGGSGSKYDLRMTDGSEEEYGNGAIVTNSSSSTSINIVIRSGITVSNLVFKPQLFDLTEIFGSGNEPSTVAEFKKYVGDSPLLGYGLSNSTIEGIKSEGNNLFDTYSTPSFITGCSVSSTSTSLSLKATSTSPSCRVEYKIPYVYVNQSVSLSCNASTTTGLNNVGDFRLLDRNKNILSNTFISSNNSFTATLSPNANAAYIYIMFFVGDWATNISVGDTTTFSNIMLNYGSTALAYEPYRKSILDLGTAYTLCGVQGINDEIDFVNQKLIRRLTTVDNGTTALITDGTTSLYALATPTETDIDLPDDYLVDNWGMETLLSDVANETAVKVAPYSEIEYSTDIGCQVKTNAENIEDNQKAVQAIKEVVPTNLNGTTLVLEDSNGIKYSITVNTSGTLVVTAQ